MNKNNDSQRQKGQYSIFVSHTIPGKGKKVCRLTRGNGQSVVKDANANILPRRITGDDGGMTFVDAQGKVLHTYSTGR